MYSVQRPSSIVNNLILGNMYIEHIGELICKREVELSPVFDADSGGQDRPPQTQVDESSITFKRGGWSRKDINKVEGEIPLSDNSEHKW